MPYPRCIFIIVAEIKFTIALYNPQLGWSLIYTLTPTIFVKRSITIAYINPLLFGWILTIRVIVNTTIWINLDINSLEFMRMIVH